jgi:hypothetical protein
MFYHPVFHAQNIIQTESPSNNYVDVQKASPNLKFKFHLDLSNILYCSTYELHGNVLAAELPLSGFWKGHYMF